VRWSVVRLPACATEITKIEPFADTTGDALIACPAGRSRCQAGLPSGWNAWSVPCSLPIYTVPSAPTTGPAPGANVPMLGTLTEPLPAGLVSTSKKPSLALFAWARSHEAATAGMAASGRRIAAAAMSLGPLRRICACLLIVASSSVIAVAGRTWRLS
jgi:hypothetical protein